MGKDLELSGSNSDPETGQLASQQPEALACLPTGTVAPGSKEEGLNVQQKEVYFLVDPDNANKMVSFAFQGVPHPLMYHSTSQGLFSVHHATGNKVVGTTLQAAKGGAFHSGTLRRTISDCSDGYDDIETMLKDGKRVEVPKLLEIGALHVGGWAVIGCIKRVPGSDRTEEAVAFLVDRPPTMDELDAAGLPEGNYEFVIVNSEAGTNWMLVLYGDGCKAIKDTRDPNKYFQRLQKERGERQQLSLPTTKPVEQADVLRIAHQEVKKPIESLTHEGAVEDAEFTVSQSGAPSGGSAAEPKVPKPPPPPKGKRGSLPIKNQSSGSATEPPQIPKPPPPPGAKQPTSAEASLTEHPVANRVEVLSLCTGPGVRVRPTESFGINGRTLQKDGVYQSYVDGGRVFLVRVGVSETPIALGI